MSFEDWKELLTFEAMIPESCQELLNFLWLETQQIREILEDLDHLVPIYLEVEVKHEKDLLAVLLYVKGNQLGVL
eukprot:CAMPEP_0170568258 /NCGR_PEP_ID=MMETSP0211-20121228/81052_1 /TAXON_ID=311385 /ORGANISM="Pseudokeronopsis sp., Strain OXSARD2" /LENGTH=74 /DNA_ID=CAMNT_0010890039 /DNA_START=564 /DNA_END=788 /DNA_ORIENTATION=-